MKRQRINDNKDADHDDQRVFVIAFEDDARELRLGHRILNECKTLVNLIIDDPTCEKIYVKTTKEMFDAHDLCVVFAALSRTYHLGNLKTMKEIIRVANAADYLDCGYVLDALSEILDERVAGKSVEEMRKLF